MTFTLGIFSCLGGVVSILPFQNIHHVIPVTLSDVRIGHVFELEVRCLTLVPLEAHGGADLIVCGRPSLLQLCYCRLVVESDFRSTSFGLLIFILHDH